MDLVLRNLVGTIHKPDGTPWAGGTVKITLSPTQADASVTVPQSTVEATLDTDGAFTSPLYTVENSYLNYDVQLPNKEVRTVSLPDEPGDADLSDLLQIAASAPEIAIRIASETALGGVKVDGTTIIIDEEGTISAVGGGGGAVDSVNSQTGTVVLDADDISDASTANKFVTAAEKTKLSNLSGTNTGDQNLTPYFHKNNDDTDDITEGANKFVSAAEKSTWNAKQNALGFTPENSANKNQNDGYAGLDSSGLIPSALLPGFVDDVIEAANFAALPGTGTPGKIYVTLDNNKTYRWSGSAYVEISASPGSTDSLTEGSVNLYFTAARVLATVLTGLSTATAATITATDTVLSALGKLQALITNLTTSVGTKADNDDVVHNSGDETIAGVKTFEESPTVPMPTNNLDAATKKYVDDNAGGGGIGGTVGTTDNALVRADGTAGDTAQGSSATLSDAGNLTLPSISTNYIDNKTGGGIVVESYSTVLRLNAFNGNLEFLRNGSPKMELDNTTDTVETAMLIYLNGTTKRVSVGAADSGGTGYKILRIPN